MVKACDSDGEVKYDPEANALYISVFRSLGEWEEGMRDKPKVKTIPVGKCDVFIDVNEDDMISGIEVLLPKKW